MGQRPTIGRVVVFRSRTGAYDVPAIVTATRETLNEKGVELWHETEGKRGVPPLDDDWHVHLTVLTPGIPGQRGAQTDFVNVSEHPIQEQQGGSYQEWNVGYDDKPDVHVEPGSWRWPQRL